MMKVITGKLFNTSFGKVLVHNEQGEKISVGERISYDNQIYAVKGIIPPTKIDGKWALSVQ